MISVAIDGPAGVGKSTVSKKLAEKLGWNCLDTGALYRAIAVACQRKGVDINSEPEVAKLLKEIDISIAFIDGVQHTYLNGEDVTPYLRTKEIDMYSSISSAYPEVRESILELQREKAREHNLVVEGRDITSNVLKESKNKFYLDASVEARAKRRYDERIARGEQISFDEVLKELIQRDHNDMTRKIAPLVKTKDAIIVDTTNMTIDQVVDFMYSRVKMA